MATDPLGHLLHHADKPVNPDAAFADALLARLLDQLATGDVTTNGEETTMTSISTMRTATGGIAAHSGGRRRMRRIVAKKGSPAFTYAATAALLLLTLASTLFAYGAPENWGMFNQSSPGVENDLIGRADVESIPDFLVTFTGISRFVLEPGEATESGPVSYYGDGVYLFEVEAGALSIESTGPMEVTSSGHDQGTPMPNGANATLQPGDRGVIFPGAATTWRNDGQDPTVVLIAAAGEATDSATEIDQIDMVKSSSIGWPKLPATFAFHRLTFEPGSSLPVAELPGLLMIGVENGSLGVPLANPDGTSARVREFVPRDGFVASDWSIAEDGEFHNSGSEPVVVYVLLAESIQPVATPAP